MTEGRGFLSVDGSAERQKTNMNEEQEEPVYIYSLGTLYMERSGKEFTLDISPNGKVMQLFLLLAYYGDKGISRVRLQDCLYDRRKTDAANGLRILSSRLRKALVNSGLSGDDFVTVEKNMYFFTGGGVINPIQIDAVQLEKKYSQALEEEDVDKKQRILWEGCSLYGGEFLPSLSGEIWVESLRSRFQDIYLSCVRELCTILKNKGDHEGLLQVCTKAMELCPMEEWASLQVECLMELKQYKEAMEVYEQAVRQLSLEQGMPTSKHMLELSKKISLYIQHSVSESSKIRSILREEWKPGPYFCTYPGFIDCYRMESRICERGKNRAMIMICTIQDGQGFYVLEEEKLQEYRNALETVIGQSLRRGDVYTEYSREQILVLANELKEDKCAQVEKRLISGFKKICGQRATVQIESISLEKWLEIPEEYRIRKKITRSKNRKPIKHYK